MYNTALEHSLEALLAQENAEGKENAFYYLSRTLKGPEEQYSPILIFAIQKLRRYLQHYHTKLITNVDPLKYIVN